MPIAKSKRESIITLTLTLTEQEARMLMAMMQNPMCNPEDESDLEESLRKGLFHALKEVIYGE